MCTLSNLFAGRAGLVGTGSQLPDENGMQMMATSASSNSRQEDYLTMATPHEIDEADIRQRIEKFVEAVRAMDLDRAMPIYAPDIVTFDVQAPLQRVGAEAKRKNWVDAFSMFRRPLGYEIRDLTITVGGDVAFAHGFGRLSGTLKNGNRGGFWVRYTVCFRKIDGNWLIAHDHASVPLDVDSGKAVLDLQP
jgi:ketosteroid isomerase-like protein